MKIESSHNPCSGCLSGCRQRPAPEAPVPAGLNRVAFVVYGLPLLMLVLAVTLAAEIVPLGPLSGPFLPLIQFAIITILTVGACIGVRAIGARLQQQVEIEVAVPGNPRLRRILE